MGVCEAADGVLVVYHYRILKDIWRVNKNVINY